MTIISSDRDVVEFRSSGIIGIAFDRFLKATASAIDAYCTRRQQKIDRKAFMNLVGKEDWIYDDMGVHRGDVEWAATLPLNINAAKELEKIRGRNTRLK